MADITREFKARENQSDDGVLELLYEDIAAGGAKDVLMVAQPAHSAKEAEELIARPVGSTGLFTPAPGCTHIVCSLKNRNGTPITWTTAPYWRGTNDPDIKIPTPMDGFALAIGDGRAVDQAFGDTLGVNEEQSCVIDCSKIPHGIFPVIEPTKQNINISLLMRVVRKQ